MHKTFVGSLAAVSCALASNAACATNLKVTVFETGKAGTSQLVASWTQGQNPVPNDYSTNYYTTVPVWNATGIGGDTEITWYSESHVGGFTNYDEEFNVLAPVTYAFTESAPTFVPGTYHGADIKQDFSYVSTVYNLTVVPDTLFKSAFIHFNSVMPGSVPEPATWAMLLVGFGMIGLATRRRPLVKVTYG